MDHCRQGQLHDKGSAAYPKEGKKWLVIIRKEGRKCPEAHLDNTENISGATCWRLMIESLLLVGQLHILGLRLSCPPQQLLQLEENSHLDNMSLLKVRSISQPKQGLMFSEVASCSK
jgi:hypothetical protein